MEITKAEAEAYLAEMDNVELDNAVLDKVAGGGCYNDNNFEPCNNFMVA